MHRQSVAVAHESIASYALLKLVPDPQGEAQRPRLNLALVLDISGSMYEEDETGACRLQRIQDAFQTAIDRLRPDDLLSIVAFAHNARVVLPATAVADRAKISAVLSKLDQVDIDPGGTAMDLGLNLGLAEVERHAATEVHSRVIVVTDGETTGEAQCRQLARRSAQNQIPFTVIGVGIEWNAGLVKEVAQLSEGTWGYIDSDQSWEAQRVIAQEFERLTATDFTGVELHVRPVKDVKVKRLRQVFPEIKDVALTEIQERHLVAYAGAMAGVKPARYIVDLSLPKRPDGNYVVAQLEVAYRANNERHSTGLLPLETRYAQAGPSLVNAEVAKHIDEVQIFEMNGNLQKAIAADNAPEVLRLAENIVRKGDLLGQRAVRKTRVARQILQEMTAGGHVSKKTQLAVDDAARIVEEVGS